jgi:hypothetical protein
VLAFARFPFLLCLVVLELAVVEQAADRGHGVRRDLYEVQIGFAGHFEGLRKRDDSQPVALVIDDKDFSGPDALVDSEFSSYCEVS